MNDAENLTHATAILAKLANGYFKFEKWPEGDGWLMLDGSTDLTADEVSFLSTVKQPEGGGGPGGMPDDYDDDEGLA